MKRAKSVPILEELFESLGDCMTPESARRIVALKAPKRLQALMADFAERHNQGQLTPEEIAEYGGYVQFDTFVAILKSKARQLLAASRGE
jgi:hypothetical protein